MEPIAELMRLPKDYGTPTTTLAWSAVRQRLNEAERYWLATTRPDGRPHLVPVDGTWLDDVWYFGGSPQTIHQRNLKRNQHVAVSLEDTNSSVIMEGTARLYRLSPQRAEELAVTSRAKYPAYPITAELYAAGVWGLRPDIVLAWDKIFVDATRFRFPVQSDAA